MWYFDFLNNKTSLEAVKTINLSGHSDLISDFRFFLQIKLCLLLLHGWHKYLQTIIHQNLTGVATLVAI